MRKLVNIGEFSFLTGVSSHTLRYYEKKGLIKPHTIDSNGYRLYSYHNYIEIVNILLLKDLGKSLEEIKELSTSFNMKDYKDMISSSIVSIDNEIKHLKQLKKQLIMQKKNFIVDNEDNNFEVIKYPDRTLYKLMCFNYDEDYSMKDMYERIYNNNIDPNEIALLNDMYIVRDNHMIYCKEKSKSTYPLDSFVFKEGNYLSYKTIVSDELFEKEIEKMFEYLSDNNYIYESELIAIMSPYTIVDSKGFYNIEFQVKIS